MMKRKGECGTCVLCLALATRIRNDARDVGFDLRVTTEQFSVEC